jgi:16S rRNA (uracil1498-N3)-methyltransferase
MRATRIFLDTPLAEGGRVRLPANQSQHVTQVLRLRPGAPLTIFNGNGRDYAARISSAGRDGVTVEIGAPGELESPLPLRIYLGVGVSRAERMDFALQKAVELGVFHLTPLFTARSTVRLDGERLQKRQQHWQGVVIAACEQSGRRCVPGLAPTERLDEWLLRRHPCPILLDPHATTPLPSMPAPSGDLTLLVGPEGGLDASECGRARQGGFAAVRLGPRILRTETAPLAAIAVAQSVWGDLRC